MCVCVYTGCEGKWRKETGVLCESEGREGEGELRVVPIARVKGDSVYSLPCIVLVYTHSLKCIVVES